MDWKKLKIWKALTVGAVVAIGIVPLTGVLNSLLGFIPQSFALLGVTLHELLSASLLAMGGELLAEQLKL
jgi:hypothetical protein